jgi:hypothetical protein
MATTKKSKASKVTPAAEAPSQEYEFHRFADLLPMMSKRECEDLKKSIQSTGQQEPIVLYEKKILDGRNRYKACLALEIEPQFSEVKIPDDQAAIDYVITRNLQRRNLTASQKAVVALRALPEIKGAVREERIRKIQAAAQAGRINANLPSSDAEKGQRGRPKQRTTVSIVGDLFGVSATYVRYAEALQRKDEKLLDRVIKGEERLYQVFKRVCPEEIKHRTKLGRRADPIGTPLDRLIRLVEKKGTMPGVLAKLQEARTALDAIQCMGKPGGTAGTTKTDEVRK